MACIVKKALSGEYCDDKEDEAAGLSQIATIFQHDDVETYPAYESVAGPEITEMEACVRAATAITMKATKFPIQLPMIMEKNGLMIKDLGRGGWLNEATIIIQNTEHNRGVVKTLKGARFSLAVQETDGDMLLLGQSTGGNDVGFLARIRPESIEEDFGVAFSDEKMIKFVVEAKPRKAVTYPYAIAYS